MSDELKEARARVDELLATNTRIETERRMWKARAEAATSLLNLALVDIPIAEQAEGRLPSSAYHEILGTIKRVAARADMLERDAWTQWAPVARMVVAEMWLERNTPDLEPGGEAGRLERLADRVASWRDRLERLLEE